MGDTFGANDDTSNVTVRLTYDENVKRQVSLALLPVLPATDTIPTWVSGLTNT